LSYIPRGRRLRQASFAERCRSAERAASYPRRYDPDRTDRSPGGPAPPLAYRHPRDWFAGIRRYARCRDGRQISPAGIALSDVCSRDFIGASKSERVV